MHWALAMAHRLEDVVAGKIFNGAMWDLVPRLGIEPGPPALGVQGLSCWTTREIPPTPFSLSSVRRYT